MRNSQLGGVGTPQMGPISDGATGELFYWWDFALCKLHLCTPPRLHHHNSCHANQSPLCVPLGAWSILGMILDVGKFTHISNHSNHPQNKMSSPPNYHLQTAHPLDKAHFLPLLCLTEMHSSTAWSSMPGTRRTTVLQSGGFLGVNTHTSLITVLCGELQN